MSGRRAHTLRLAETPEDVARTAAAEIIALLETALAWRGEAHLALAGGSTPRLLHAALAAVPFDGWPHVHVWFGDERCVPPDHPDSNAGMARETLLDRVPIADDHIHRMEGERAPDEAARRYDDALTAQAERLGRELPLLDVLVLGMGADGHTASLFPGSPLLAGPDAAPPGPTSGAPPGTASAGRWCAAVEVPSLDAWRLTLTPRLLQAAAAVTVLVTGAGKHDALQRVLLARAAVTALPARLLEDARGDVAWFVDGDALFG